MFAIDKMDLEQLTELWNCCLDPTNKRKVYKAIAERFDLSWLYVADTMFIVEPDHEDDGWPCPLYVVKEELAKILSEMGLLGVLDKIILDASIMGDNYSWDIARAKLMERGYRMRLTPHLEKVKSL